MKLSDHTVQEVLPNLAYYTHKNGQDFLDSTAYLIGRFCPGRFLRSGGRRFGRFIPLTGRFGRRTFSGRFCGFAGGRLGGRGLTEAVVPGREAAGRPGGGLWK